MLPSTAALIYNSRRISIASQHKRVIQYENMPIVLVQGNIGISRGRPDRHIFYIE